MAEEKNPQGKRRTQLQIVRDRRRMAEMYLQQGLGQIEIAEELKLSQSTVSRDLQELISEWKKSALVDVDDAIAEELAKINALELEYWAAWRKSQEPNHKKTNVKKSEMKGLGYLKQSASEEQRIGDPRYLAGVQWCIEQRRAILGLDAPIKRDTEFNFDEWKLKRSERLKEVQAIKPVSSESDPEQ